MTLLNMRQLFCCLVVLFGLYNKVLSNECASEGDEYNPLTPCGPSLDDFTNDFDRHDVPPPVNDAYADGWNNEQYFASDKGGIGLVDQGYPVYIAPLIGAGNDPIGGDVYMSQITDADELSSLSELIQSKADPNFNGLWGFRVSCPSMTYSDVPGKNSYQLTIITSGTNGKSYLIAAFKEMAQMDFTLYFDVDGVDGDNWHDLSPYTSSNIGIPNVWLFDITPSWERVVLEPFDFCSHPADCNGHFFLGSSIEANCTDEWVYKDEGVTGSTCVLVDGVLKWDMDLDAVCTLVDCGTPIAANLEVISLPNTTYGSVGVYGCQSGFVHRKGYQIISCEADGNWSSFLENCTADCGVPEALVTGSAIFEDGPTIEGSILEANCTAGQTYLDEGVTGLTCVLVDGVATWVPGPDLICTPKDCGTPSAANVEVISLPNTTYGSVGVFGCQSGFSHRNGYQTIECGDDGWSPSLESCTADCGVPMATVTGSVIYGDGPTTEGSTLEANCSAGQTYLDDGVTGSRCVLVDGVAEWDPHPDLMCIADCGVPTATGSAIFEDGPTVQGSTLGATCAAGQTYLDNGVTGTTCVLVDGVATWSPHPDLMCTPVDCGHPIFPKGVNISIQLTTFGATAMVSCIEGYRPIQSLELNSIMCDFNGQWQPRLDGFCEIVDCGGLPTARNVIQVSSEGSKVNQVALFKCGPRNVMANGETVQYTKCKPDGQWTELNDCLGPEDGCLIAPTLNTATSKKRTGFEIGDSIVYECDEGFLGPDQTSVCIGNGLWEPVPHECALETEIIVVLKLDLPLSPGLLSRTNPKHISYCNKLYATFHNQLPSQVTEFDCTFRSGSVIAVLSFVSSPPLTILEQTQSYMAIRNIIEENGRTLPLETRADKVLDMNLIISNTGSNGNRVDTNLNIHDACALYEFENVCTYDCLVMNDEPVCENKAPRDLTLVIILVPVAITACIIVCICLRCIKHNRRQTPRTQEIPMSPFTHALAYHGLSGPTMTLATRNVAHQEPTMTIATRNAANQPFPRQIL